MHPVSVVPHKIPLGFRRQAVIGAGNKAACLYPRFYPFYFSFHSGTVSGKNMFVESADTADISAPFVPPCREIGIPCTYFDREEGVYAAFYPQGHKFIQFAVAVYGKDITAVTVQQGTHFLIMIKQVFPEKYRRDQGTVIVAYIFPVMRTDGAESCFQKGFCIAVGDIGKSIDDFFQQFRIIHAHIAQADDPDYIPDPADDTAHMKSGRVMGSIVENFSIMSQICGESLFRPLQAWQVVFFPRLSVHENVICF